MCASRCGGFDKGDVCRRHGDAARDDLFGRVLAAARCRGCQRPVDGALWTPWWHSWSLPDIVSSNIVSVVSQLEVAGSPPMDFGFWCWCFG
jgi:hypothetical protein